MVVLSNTKSNIGVQHESIQKDMSSQIQTLQTNLVFLHYLSGQGQLEMSACNVIIIAKVYHLTPKIF